MNVITRESSFVLLVVMLMSALATIVASALYLSSSSQLMMAHRQIRFEKAFYIAESGIEHAKAVLRNSHDGLNDELIGADSLTNTADDGVLSFGSSVSFAGGLYNVKIVNDTNDAGLFMDTNDTVIIWCTGTFENVKRVIQASIHLPNPVTIPMNVDGSLSLYGTNTEVQLQGDALVDGRDYNVPANFTCSGAGCLGTLIDTNPAAPGIFSSSTSTVVNVDNPAVLNGTPPVDIGGSGDYTEQDWQDMAQELIPLATTTIAGGKISGNATIGTRANPEIAVITGIAEVATLGNVDGAGILIIMEGAELKISGTFHYEGIIILMGDNVDDAAIEFTALGNATLFGGIVGIGNELDIEIQGSPQIVYSTEALENLKNLDLPLNQLSILYWHEVK